MLSKRLLARTLFAITTTAAICSQASADPVAGSGYSLGLGADLLGGSLEVAGQSVGPAADGRVRMDASWTGVWREQRWLKQLRLGDGVTTGPRGRSVHGVMLTNAPFVRPSFVGALRYDGRLEPGWSVEAYRGGDLVAFDSTDAQGGFAIALPVRYGENPVDFVAYGPFGEIREFNRTYRVLTELLPPGRFEYGLSAGQCRSTLCETTANLLSVAIVSNSIAGPPRRRRCGFPGRIRPPGGSAGD